MMQTQAQKYTVTQDSVVIVWDGKPVSAKKGAPNFENLKEAIIKGIRTGDWSEVPHHLAADSSLERWAQGKFKVTGGRISFNGDDLPGDLNSRIVEMASLGQDPTPVMKFWENLKQNPSNRSVEQLWRFLNNSGHPLTDDGHFLAYKAVKPDFKDIYSGTIENKPGTVVEMERNKISDDPNQTCHYGLHVGALDYAQGFGGNDRRIVIVKVHPRDVVSVPVDYSSQKMRVCRYEVVGLHGEGHLPNTVIGEDDLPSIASQRSQPASEGGSTVHKPLPGGKRRLKEFKRLDALDEASLMKETYETLREYLSKGLEVVGASRIVGGKWALVQAIANARR